MDIMHLRYFKAIAEQESITSASELLHISQPALSASLSKLEKELGFQLFDRVGRHIQLNQYGKIYFKYVTQALACMDNANRELENCKSQRRQTLNISTVSMRLLQEMISDFIACHDEITVRLHEIMLKDAENEVENSDCDFVIVDYCGEPEFPGESRIIKRERLYLAVDRHHPLAGRESVSLSELKDNTFISLPKGYGFREMMDKLCQGAGFQCDVLHECFHCHLLDYVSDGIGVAFVEEQLVKAERSRQKDDSGVAFLNISDEDAYRNIVLRWDGSRVMSLAAKKLLDFAQDYYKPDSSG